MTNPTLQQTIWVYTEENREITARDSSEDARAGRSLCKERGRSWGGGGRADEVEFELPRTDPW